MILTRLASAIRHQNWSQIITEILIVVIGIFLGLQVQAWYDGRNAAQEEQRVLGYLISDMDETIEHLNNQVLRAERQIELTFKILDILEKGELSAEDVADFEVGIQRLGRVQPADPFIKSFEDDNLSRILVDDMRNLIGDYLGRLAGGNALIANSVTTIKFLEEVTTLKTPFQRTLDGETLVYYDFDQLKSDSEYRAALISINGQIYGTLQTYKGILARSQLMLEALIKYQLAGTVEELEPQ